MQAHVRLRVALLCSQLSHVDVTGEPQIGLRVPLLRGIPLGLPPEVLLRTPIAQVRAKLSHLALLRVLVGVPRKRVGAVRVALGRRGKSVGICLGNRHGRVVPRRIRCTLRHAGVRKPTRIHGLGRPGARLRQNWVVLCQQALQLPRHGLRLGVNVPVLGLLHACQVENRRCSHL